MLGGTWKTYCSCAAGTRRVRGGAWPKVQPLRMLENSWPPSAVSSEAFSRRSLADPPQAGKMRPSLQPLMQTEKSRHGAARGTAAIPRLYLPGCSPRICIHFLVSACARKKREAPVLFVIDGNKLVYVIWTLSQATPAAQRRGRWGKQDALRSSYVVKQYKKCTKSNYLWTFCQ